MVTEASNAIDLQLLAQLPAEKFAFAVPYQPLNEWVLIEKIEDGEKVTKGGIEIPEQFQSKSNKGVIISVGEGRVVGSRIVPIPLVEGDIVLFTKFGGQEIKLEDKPYLLVRYAEVYLKARR